MIQMQNLTKVGWWYPNTLRAWKVSYYLQEISQIWKWLITTWSEAR